MESQTNFDWTISNGRQFSQLPEEFCTIRRRASRMSTRKKRILSNNSIQPSRESEIKYLSQFDCILDQIDQLTNKLNSENFMNEFALELNSEKSQYSDRHSRDSGIASSYCSDSGFTSCWTDSSSTEPLDGMVSLVQKRICKLLQSWVKDSPNTFGDEIIQKSISSFFRFLSANKCISISDRTKLMNELDAQLRFSYQFRQRIQKSKHMSSVNLR